ncbi:phosphoadenosine phosphosulfate reductase family protein [Clostridium botulinum]|uniref:Phospho-adenylylsulfate sulfotransferase n=1 Tax=Clostridium botulinum TaxID=1491 RepID=A0A9Q1UVV6_CLOBO|nr:phosphoadenosine phosphosulfate reductase family protein [Clostridium botulinum]AEB77241.1 putative phospho-adenylylsulfate sulfotransferase [Clostridium botulinum BKT015925]KEH96243.1 phospho-adenylylsulfate sulfotransferase [Clostridium botulinum C/D str. Sp77]KLU74343.1 putative phospho-adenylylsulfate sulfotransferase [Clostridium botulinum V891]KOA80443.1 phospho-adenylylsulfate sulfotransferase [Clostridium botulinum]KOA82627.1 phospho-adenylylsulfate sulfotransferase [Clostridium bot
MKPIFNEEKVFLQEILGVELPNNCWRDGSSIYINPNTKPAILRFKVDGEKVSIVKNRIVSFDKDNITMEIKNNKFEIIHNNNLNEEYELHKEYIHQLEEESIQNTTEYILNHPNVPIRVGISGGKDSDVMYYILRNYVFPKAKILRNNYSIDVYNTTNDTPDTYRHILRDLKIEIKDIHTPEKGWYKWLKEDKNYFLPSVTVRNCCSTYKEGRVKKILDKKQEYISFVGMRKYESTKRSNYDWDLNEAINKSNKNLNVPEHWHRFLPIVNWRDEDVWLYILHNKIKINHMYYLGFNRTGCLLCPYSSDYNDLLIKKYYPFLWNRWTKMLEKNYEVWGVKRRLKWTKEEWINGGKWKQGMSKEYELTRLKPTPERVQKLAEIKGISEEIARRYFQHRCSCGKLLNPDEIAMFLKRNGSFQGTDDNRQYLCKKCMCSKEGWTSEEYKNQVIRFREQGCNLF